MAELWAVYYGLCLAWNEGYRFVILEVDSRTTQQLWLAGTCTVQEANNLWFQCVELLGRQWTVNIVHGYREVNQVADTFTSLSLVQCLGFQVLESPPPEVVRLLEQDASGVTFPRAIVV
ncbi:hypothetical protein PTKIN_Ptkin14bG0210400 [Pterospermum kingtungense]